MDLLSAFIDMVLHLDQHLLLLTQSYGTWVHLILFAIVYCETGLVVMPLLPGDSLLFVARVGRMDYRRFLPYSLAGGVLWVGGLVSAGYFLGGFPMVKENLTLVILGILLISLLPGILAYLRREDPGQPDAAPAGDPPVSGTP